MKKWKIMKFFASNLQDEINFILAGVDLNNREREANAKLNEENKIE